MKATFRAAFAARITVLFVGVILTVGCSDVSQPSSLTVFAASSTTEATQKVCADFSAQTGRHVDVSFAASSTLARQIEAGAPAALFLSANADWADYLEKRGLVESRTNLLANRLVVIEPVQAPEDIRSPDDLKSPDIVHIAVGDPSSVPAGMYAKEALEHLGLWEVLLPKLVPSGNVRQALLYVERGEAEAGIVYATDAAISGKVRVAVTLDPALSSPVEYPLVLLKSRSPDPEARALYRYFKSPEAVKVFRDCGFSVLDNVSGEREKTASQRTHP